MNYSLRKKPMYKDEFFTVEITGKDNKGDYVTTKEKYPKKLFDEKVSYEIQDLLLKGSGEGKLEYYNDGFHITIPTGYGERTPTLISVDIVYTDGDGVDWAVDMVPARYTEEDEEWYEQLMKDQEKVNELYFNSNKYPVVEVVVYPDETIAYLIQEKSEKEFFLVTSLESEAYLEDNRWLIKSKGLFTPISKEMFDDFFKSKKTLRELMLEGFEKSSTPPDFFEVYGANTSRLAVSEKMLMNIIEHKPSGCNLLYSDSF